MRGSVPAKWRCKQKNMFFTAVDNGHQESPQWPVPIDLVLKTYVSQIRDCQSVSNIVKPYTHYITFVQYSAKS
jgi:hypothetical protein